jgi:hypothetical protein
MIPGNEAWFTTGVLISRPAPFYSHWEDIVFFSVKAAVTLLHQRNTNKTKTNNR